MHVYIYIYIILKKNDDDDFFFMKMRWLLYPFDPRMLRRFHSLEAPCPTKEMGDDEKNETYLKNLDNEIRYKINLMVNGGEVELESEIRDLIAKRRRSLVDEKPDASQRSYLGLLREAILANAVRGKISMKKFRDGKTDKLL